MEHEKSSKDTTSVNVRAGIVIFIAAGAVFALFGSNELVSMAYDLPENAWTAPLVSTAEDWHQAMQALGPAAAAQAVRDAVAELRLFGWS